MTVLDALRRATAQLHSAGVDSPEHDAEVLLRHVLGWDRARLLADGPSPLAPADLFRYVSLVDERSRRRPLQHLTGRQWFWGREFAVTPHVLVPRPETELLVQAGRELVEAIQAPLIVDVGTGSGCIAVSLAGEREDAEVHAVDISPHALAVARDNARRLGVGERITFHHGDLLAPVEALAGRIDLLVSNPPYVSGEDLATLAPEVARHEPRLALVPPGDTLSLYRRLAHAAARMLRPGASVGVEIGLGMEDDVVRTLSDAGLPVDGVIPDLAGIARVVIAHRPMG